MDTPSTLPAETTIGRVALRVADLDRQVAFYESVIGLDVLRRQDGRAELGAGGEPLLVLVADSEAAARRREEAGLFHVAFLVPSRAALGDALERIQSRWRLDGASDHVVSEALYLADPEGTGIEVYRDRPRETWPVADDGTIGIDTLALDLESVRSAARGRGSAPPETTVGHVHLEVSSVPAAAAFYGEALGMATTRSYRDSARFLAAGGYHHHLGINTWNGRSAPARARGRGLEWFEVVVPDADAVAACRERFGARGVEPTAIANHGGRGGNAPPNDARGFDVVDDDGIRTRVRQP